MKQFYLNAPQQLEPYAIDSLLAELLLEQAIRNFRKEQIHKEIDQSLRNRDKEAFMRLTEELKHIY
ncbi:IDEAL domain-containing protein [Ectobacillus funiculus]|uniref:IDEAL domain-containing protein n=1 Tax=Ectobacillus funiculus TaxID=137993 RepID=A0ABV5W9K1_9BACI|nr:IDEAL domain-containing protein [Ectobacillus funiculus]